jgi:hypothetical protein
MPVAVTNIETVKFYCERCNAVTRHIENLIEHKPGPFCLKCGFVNSDPYAVAFCPSCGAVEWEPCKEGCKAS